MKPWLQVLSYIVNNNPWYQIPQRCLQALCYQVYKRTRKGVFSKQLFNGKRIFLFPHSPNSSAFIYTHIPDKPEIMALRTQADHHTIFIDVGANMGDYSVLLMDKVQTIYAFEAHPATARLCKMNFLLNGLDEQQVIAKAVSDNDEMKYFSDLGEASPINSQVAYSDEALQVPAITLDQFVTQRVWDKNANFILKVDVEGFEHEVFAGAKQFLSQYPVKAIVFELFSEKVDEIIRFLHDVGFTTRQISQNNMLCVRNNRERAHDQAIPID